MVVVVVVAAAAAAERWWQHRWCGGGEAAQLLAEACASPYRPLPLIRPGTSPCSTAVGVEELPVSGSPSCGGGDHGWVCLPHSPPLAFLPPLFDTP